jgi:hypothetical protein
MKLFLDSSGRQWAIDANVAAFRRIRDLAGVNLLDTDAVRDSADILQDTEILINALCAICYPQIERRDMTSEEFGESLADVDVIRKAIALMIEELNFFLQSRQSHSRNLTSHKRTYRKDTSHSKTSQHQH